MNAALSPGAKLGRYEIRSQLGVGGMGEVYLAQDTTLDRKVALKVLPENVASNRNRMQRFVQEAKAASALNHPNIITIHEIGTEPGAHFMVTEFIDGENLRHHLRQPMNLGEAIDIAIQVASALATAHAAGIIHRDIKPENIMLRRDGIAKVLDFGLAKLTEHWRADDVNGDAATQAFVHTEPGTVVGTTAYLSPEQARGLEVDPRTDIWSLGVLLYEMITGRAPFKSETASDTSAAILKTEPPPLSEFVAEVPAEIERIVRKALQKNREERYQGVKDMLLDLKTLKRDLDVGAAMQRSGAPYSQDAMTRAAISTAPPATTAYTSLLTTGRGLNRKAVLMAAAAALLIAGAATWYWWRHREVDTGRPGALTVNQLFNRKNGLVERGTTHARFSPDGKFVAYASSRGNNNTIWLKQVVSGEPFTNQPDLPAAASPIWSPDGLQIAFLSKRQGQNGIWTMAAFGGSPTLFKALENSPRELIAWTRSGKIYFAMQGDLYFLTVATQQVSPVTALETPRADRDFAISPDEKQVVYSDFVDGQSDLWVVPVGGGRPARVTNDKPKDSNPAWTPDSKRIVYSSNRNGIKQIFVAQADGSGTAQLNANDSNSSVLDVSPDGSRILYSTDRDESDLWSVRLDQQKESQLTTDTGIKLWPDVSPDGKSIAYQLVRATTGATLLNSLLMSKSLSGDEAPVQLAADGFAPLWSPDGKQVAFLRYLNGTNDLWVVHATGGDARALTTSGVIFGGFTQLPFNRVQTQDFHWSRDGDHLIYCAKTSNFVDVWEIGTDGSAPVRLSDNSDASLRIFNPVSSPDGQRLAWLGNSSDTRAGSVWLLDHGQQKKIFESNSALGILGWSPSGDELIIKTVSGSDTAPNAPVDVDLIAISGRDDKQRSVAQLPAAYFQNIKLAPPGNQIAYVSRAEGTDSLRVIPVTGGAPKTIVNTTDPRVYLAALVWSPDGKTIYYGKQASWTVFSMIDNFK